MTDKTYRYDGPISGVTLREAGKKLREVMLFPGKTVQLPAANAHVQALIARGHLTEEVSPKPKSREK